MGLAILILGLAIFIAPHVLVSLREERAKLIVRFGERPYKGLISLVAAAYIPGTIKKALKHPMLAGVKLWAFAHLLSSGDLGGIVLFGSVLAWAVYDRISLKRRTDPGAPKIPVG